MEWKISPLPVDYPEAIRFMEDRVQSIRAGGADEMVWLLEHPPLYTAGTSARGSDLIDANRFPVYPTGRGGQFTYHGPGQRIAYVMLDLKKRAHPRAPDIRAFVHQLEGWIIATLAEFEIAGKVYPDRVGVWVEDKTGEQAKIAALGIRIRQGVSYHGISLNVHPDLSHYSGIVPCGISQFGVTSIHALGHKISVDECDKILINKFSTHFDIKSNLINS